MLRFLKNLFADCFQFKPERFEQFFFTEYNIPYSKKYFENEHWVYTYKDITYKVNSLECIVYLNGKERFHVEFIHNMKYNAETLFNTIRVLY